MLFDRTQEQREFQESVRGVLGREWPAPALRRMWEGEAGGSTRVTRLLAELGVQSIAVPEACGGAGASAIELGLALEEIGEAGFPAPVLESAVTARLLAKTSQQTEVVEALISGTATATVSVADHAPIAHHSTTAAVLALRGSSLHLVPAERISFTPVAGQDPTRDLAVAELPLDAATVITDEPGEVELVLAELRAGTASLLVGLSQHLITVTRDYLLEREQFGTVIGSFQALKHRLTDCLVAVEAARGLTWYASYAISADSADMQDAARAAKSAAGSAAHLTNAAALQLHGGIGFTWEHDLHLWLKRGLALQRLYGTTTEHRRHLGAGLISAAHPTDPVITSDALKGQPA